MTDVEMWAGLVGFWLPVVLAFVEKETWLDRTKAVVAFLCCLAAGAGTAYFTGQFDPGSIARSCLIVCVSAMTFYKAFWQKIGLGNR